MNKLTCKTCKAEVAVCGHIAADMVKLAELREQREAERKQDEAADPKSAGVEAFKATPGAGGAFDRDDAWRLHVAARRVRQTRLAARALELVMAIDAPFDTVTGGGFRCPDPKCDRGTSHSPDCRWGPLVEDVRRNAETPEAREKAREMLARDRDPIREVDMSKPEHFARAIELALAASDPSSFGPIDLGALATMLEDVQVGDEVWGVYHGKGDDTTCVAITGNGPTSEANARFLVDARAMVLGLVSRVDELQTFNRLVAGGKPAESNPAIADGPRRRTRSSEPEPKPRREPGYYWVQRNDDPYPGQPPRKPEIAFYASMSMRDQEPGAAADARIICEWVWQCSQDYAGDDGLVVDGAVSVLSTRIRGPEEWSSVPKEVA